MVSPCGFESHLSHQKIRIPIGDPDFLMQKWDSKRAALPLGKAIRCPVDTLLARGRVHKATDATERM